MKHLKIGCQTFTWEMLGDAWTPTGQRRDPLVRAAHGAAWALLSQVLAHWSMTALLLDLLAFGLGLSMLAAAAIGWIAPVLPGAPLVWEDHVIRVTEIVVGAILFGAAGTWIAPLALRSR